MGHSWFDVPWIGSFVPFLERFRRCAPYTGGVPGAQEVTVEQPPLEWESPLFHTALAQFEQAVPHAEISDAVRERLSYPERSLIVSVPVRFHDRRPPSF